MRKNHHGRTPMQTILDGMVLYQQYVFERGGSGGT